MKRFLSGVASLAAVTVLAGGMVGGALYLRHLRTPGMGQADGSPSTSETLAASPTRTDSPSPSPSDLATATATPSTPPAPTHLPKPSPLPPPCHLYPHVKEFTAAKTNPPNTQPQDIVVSWSVSDCPPIQVTIRYWVTQQLSAGEHGVLLNSSALSGSVHQGFTCPTPPSYPNPTIHPYVIYWLDLKDAMGEWEGISRTPSVTFC